MFASVTDCLKNKRFIHECLSYTENNFSRTSNSLNCVNFTITLSLTFCIIQGDPHRPTQMDCATRPNPRKEKIWDRPDPWMDPIHVQLCTNQINVELFELEAWNIVWPICIVERVTVVKLRAARWCSGLVRASDLCNGIHGNPRIPPWFPMLFPWNFMGK